MVRFLLLLALILPLPAAAQSVPGALAGSWALQVGEATIFRFDLEPVPGQDEWRATWVRPSRFASNGESFNRIQLPAREIRSMAGLVIEDAVEISFPDPRPGAIPDIFRFRLIDSDAVEMTYVGTGLDPYLLYRVAPGAALGPFREGATYSVRPPEESEALPTIDAENVLDLPASSEARDEPEDFRLPPREAVGR